MYVRMWKETVVGYINSVFVCGDGERQHRP